MWRMSVLLSCLLVAACVPEPVAPPAGGDFAVLAQAAENFQQARSGTGVSFPADHGAHPGYRIEWWYLTANLEDQMGRPHGAQWTLFRIAMEPPGTMQSENPWQSGQLFMAHMAVSTPEEHFAFQRYARGGMHSGLAQAGAEATPFAAWLDDWSLASDGPGWLPLTASALQADNGFVLHLSSDRPPVLQGDNGFSRKHPKGGGSMYYSQPWLAAEGKLTINGEDIDVNGLAWLDREWSSQFLQPDQVGWDWLALHLDSGEKLMVFQLRSTGSGDPYRHAVLLDPAGGRQVLGGGDIIMEPLEHADITDRTVPVAWRIELTTLDRRIELRALHEDQWMDLDFPYWEGVVLASGDGPGNRGRGYMELTGYSR